MQGVKSLDFSLDLWRHLSQSENGIVSPISVLSAFSMLLAGAKTHSAVELKKALHVDAALGEDKYHHAFAGYIESINKLANGGDDLTISLANRLFLQKDFHLESHFVTTLDKNYFAKVGEVDFHQASAAASAINSWVEENTNHKIKDLIQSQSISNDTKLILVNAIHFKGKWLDPFKAMNTEDWPFHLPSGQTKTVSMMSREESMRALDDSKKLHAQAAELPFRGERFSMVVLVPKEITGLKALEAALTPSELQRVMKEMSPKRVGLLLPKFKVESTLDLNDAMKKLGAVSLFSDAADFSGITQSHKLFVSKAVHKAYLEVNEEGAEAAAATGIQMMCLCMPPPPEFTIKADRPFLAWIWDRQTETVLFMARVCEPSDPVRVSEPAWE